MSGQVERLQCFPDLNPAENAKNELRRGWKEVVILDEDSDWSWSGGTAQSIKLLNTKLEFWTPIRSPIEEAEGVKRAFPRGCCLWWYSTQQIEVCSESVF